MATAVWWMFQSRQRSTHWIKCSPPPTHTPPHPLPRTGHTHYHAGTMKSLCVSKHCPRMRRVYSAFDGGCCCCRDCSCSATSRLHRHSVKGSFPSRTFEYLILIPNMIVFCASSFGAFLRCSLLASLPACHSHPKQPRHTGPAQNVAAVTPQARAAANEKKEQKKMKRPARGATQDGAEIPLMYFSIRFAKSQSYSCKSFLLSCLFFCFFLPLACFSCSLALPPNQSHY